ncbi:hypothetical protein ACLEPN_05770 [Myxococcus sp. 1LA]
MMFAMDVAPEMTLPSNESAYIAKVDAPQSGGYTPNGFETGAMQPANDGTAYSLAVYNKSAQPWTFYIYQTNPAQLTDPNFFSLAWLATPYEIVPGAYFIFKWTINYTFLWAQTGTLKPDVSFEAGMSIPADPSAGDTTYFSVSPGPNLSPAQPSDDHGTLMIQDDPKVPPSTFSVGIGMGDAGTFAVQAGANLKHYFTPTPSYWIAAGVDMKVGTVLDIQTITETAPVVYDDNVYSLTAVLNDDNTWTISQ